MKRYRIRRFAAGDSLDELTSMIHRAFARLGRMGFGCLAVEQPLATTARRARRGECFVALDGERIVGTMTLEPPDRGAEFAWYRRPDVASLHQFAVDPCHQGQGCGKALLLSAEHWARRRGYRELALDTPAGATDLVAFYEERGFRVVGQIQHSDRPYRSAILSRTIATVQAQLGLWYSPHRSGWSGALG